MVQAILLGQLTLVCIFSVKAFHPWFPSFPCQDETVPCLDSKNSLDESKEGIALPLIQRTPKIDEDPVRRAAHAAQRLARKYGLQSTSRHQHTPRLDHFSISKAASPIAKDSAGVDSDGIDFSYFVKAGIGSPKKSMYMLLDTGAGTSWVMASSCQSLACNMHNKYVIDDSQTYATTGQSFSILYGSGSVNGDLMQDTISVAGLSNKMTLGIANVTSDEFTHFPFDGILGLSLSKGSTDNYLTVLKNAKTLKTNILGITLARGLDEINTGEVTFGATNPAKYAGSISYTSVTDVGGDWAIPMDGLGYDGAGAGVHGRTAYIDTGTSFAFGPSADVAALHNLVPGATTADNVTFSVPCSARNLSVTFSGITYSISSKDWIATGSGDKCTSNIHGHEVVTGAWLLGDVFLKNVYSVFDWDQSRVGFAVKATGSSSSGMTTLASPATSSVNASTDGTGLLPTATASGDPETSAVKTSAAQESFAVTQTPNWLACGATAIGLILFWLGVLARLDG